jgi:hypothetical protein
MPKLVTIGVLLVLATVLCGFSDVAVESSVGVYRGEPFETSSQNSGLLFRSLTLKARESTIGPRTCLAMRVKSGVPPGMVSSSTGAISPAPTGESALVCGQFTEGLTRAI